MRPDRESDSALLIDILRACEEVVSYTGNVSAKEYASNRMMRRAVERLVEIIGEASSHLSSEFREKHPDIPWRQIIGQRNVLAHDYGEILDDRMYSVATVKIPDLLNKLKSKQL
jgi:uncharacterized protein with HEPN domain